MSGHTITSEQRVIVQTGRYDSDRFIREKSQRDPRTQSQRHIQLFPPPAGSFEQSMQAGDLLFMLKSNLRQYLKRDRGSSQPKLGEGDLQKPAVSSVLDGLSVLANEYEKTEPWLPEEERKQRAAEEAIVVLGFSRKPYEFDPRGPDNADAPTIMIGGTKELLNNGDHYLAHGVYCYYVVPRIDANQYNSQEQGKSFTMSRLHLVPFNNPVHVSLESLTKWVLQFTVDRTTERTFIGSVTTIILQGVGTYWSVEKEFLYGMYAAQKDGELIVDPDTQMLTRFFDQIVRLIYVGIKLRTHPDKRAWLRYSTAVNKMLRGHAKPMLDVQKKIVCKVMRSAMPGGGFEGLIAM